MRTVYSIPISDIMIYKKYPPLACSIYFFFNKKIFSKWTISLKKLKIKKNFNRDFYSKLFCVFCFCMSK